jgi:hypothetical protein
MPRYPENVEISLQVRAVSVIARPEDGKNAKEKMARKIYFTKNSEFLPSEKIMIQTSI